MTNPLEVAANLPPDETSAVMATPQHVWGYFKDYDHTHLGTYRYTKKFSNGVETVQVLDIFPKIALIRTERITAAPPMSQEELLQFTKEFEANTDRVFAEAAERGGINSATARTFGFLDGVVVLFEPRRK